MSIKNVARCLSLVVLILFAAGCARNVETARSTKWNAKQFTQGKLPKFDVPIVVNDKVVAWIDYFQGPAHNTFARYLARSGKYVPLMQNILKKYSLPQDLVYVALIESGFSAKAYSRAKASGHWQFIGGTGKRYGLSINNWMDERRHEEKSTEAAAKYLSDLYNEFGDWYLAMAAYNAGEGKIRRAIQKTGTRDFWEILERDRHYLRNETRDYVPKFIAAAIIAKSPDRFGFGDVVYDKPFDFETAKVPSPTDIQVVAKCAKVSVEEIEDLNPELTRGATPPNVSDYEVRLPRGTARTFEIAYANVPESERLLALRHTVKRGESAGKIAKRYGVSVREILAANGLRNVGSLKKGMTIIIPTGGVAKEKMKVLVAEEDTSVPRGKVLKHKVRRGETLAAIADNYGVDRSMLRRWNKLKSNQIHAGQLLKVYSRNELADAAKKAEKKNTKLFYSVRRNDSWAKIAQKYGVSINELKDWNPKVAKRGLQIGQKLKIVEEPVKTEAVALNVPATEVIATSERLTPPSETQTSGQSISVAEVKPDMISMDMPKSDLIASNETISYKVKSGDTLWDIARKYNVSVKDIQEWNGLDGSSKKRIKAGDKITLKVFK